ncbi:MAG: hypothetical protein GC155_06040 [Alphaproteobacteria bacterium]|nr:hypothetical protein [Alphaproteobacteria bacterium]
MDVSLILNQAKGLWTRGDAFLAASPVLSRIGAGLAVLIGLVLAFLVIRSVFRMLAAVHRAATAASIQRMKDVGARMLVVRGGGGRRGAVGRFLRQTADQHLSDFMFGGPFRVIPFPGTISNEQEADLLLRRTGADLLMWGERQRGTRGVARIASRPSSPFEKRRPAQTLRMPDKKAMWTEALSRAVAYAAAKQFRPALGRPQDFRSERLQPVVENLLEILAEKPAADPKLLAEMVDDAASGALQLAFAGDEAWLDQSVEITRATLTDINRSEAPDRWIAAKINLGRALRLKAEKRFDPVLLRESIEHLSEALDALRTEPRFKLAESAAQAIADAQRLLGARRKFSISSGGV